MFKRKVKQAAKAAQASTPAQDEDAEVHPQVKRKLNLKTPKTPKDKPKIGVPKVYSLQQTAQDTETGGVDDTEPRSTAKEAPNTASEEERLLDESLQARIMQAYHRGRRDAEKAPTSRAQGIEQEEYRPSSVHDQARGVRVEPGEEATSQTRASRTPLKPRYRYSGGLNLKVFVTDYLWAAKANGWDIPTTRTVLRYYIDDPALQVYDDMVRQRASEGVDVEDIPIEAVYDVLEAQFMSTQAKNKAHNNLFRLRKKPDESVSDFLTRFRQVSQLASVPDDEKLADTFLRATKMHIVNNSFRNLREASDAAMRVEEANDTSGDEQDVRHPRSKPVVLAPIQNRTKDARSDQEEQFETKLQTAKRATSPTRVQAVQVLPTSSNDPILPERLVCAFCSNSGHSIVECRGLLRHIRSTTDTPQQPAPKRQYDRISPSFNQAYKRQRTDDVNNYRRVQEGDRSDQRPEQRTCYGCNQPGHIRANCPRAPRQYQQATSHCTICEYKDKHQGYSCAQWYKKMDESRGESLNPNNKDPRSYLFSSYSATQDGQPTPSSRNDSRTDTPFNERALVEIGLLDAAVWSTKEHGKRKSRRFARTTRRRTEGPSSIVIDGAVNGTPVQVTVDTGAQVTVISEALYKQLRSPRLTDVSSSATGAAGEQLVVLGALTVLLTFGVGTWPFLVWVIRGLRSTMLLGQDFGRVHHMIIETSIPRVTIEGVQVPIVKGQRQSVEPQVQAIVEAQGLVTSVEAGSRVVNIVAVDDHDWSGEILFTEVPVKMEGSIPAHWLSSESAVFVESCWNGGGALLTNAIKTPEDLKANFYLGGVNMTGAPVRILSGQLMARAILCDGLAALIRLASKDMDRENILRSAPDVTSVLEVCMVGNGNQILNGSSSRREASQSAMQRSDDGWASTGSVVGDRTGLGGLVSESACGRGVLWDPRRLGAGMTRTEDPYPAAETAEDSHRASKMGGSTQEVTESMMRHTQGSCDLSAASATPRRSRSDRRLSTVEGTGNGSQGNRDELSEAGNVEVGIHPRRGTSVNGSRSLDASSSGDISQSRDRDDARTKDVRNATSGCSETQSSVATGTGRAGSGMADGGNLVAENDTGKDHGIISDSGSGAAQGTGTDEDEETSRFLKEIELKVIAQNGALTEEQSRQLTALMLEYKDVLRPKQLGQALDEEYDIQVPQYETSVKYNDRRWSPKEIEQIAAELDKLLKGGFIEPSDGPWASRLVLVVKKDGSTRVCVDYRGVNEKTITDAYPTPVLDQVVSTVAGNVWFSTLDAEKGYYQIKLTERSKQITAFTCPFGLFQWSKMPFGLKNAPAYFQRVMDMALRGLSWKCCMVFFDDIVVFSQTWQAHLQDLAGVLGKLRAKNITLNFNKCEFARTELVYLGYLIDKQGLRPNPAKVEAVTRFEAPKTVSQLRTFLGMTGQFRRFIRDYATVARPLQELIKSGTGKKRDNTFLELVWLEPQQSSFDSLKQKLAEVALLKFPNQSKPLILTTDASDYAIGAMLSQKDDDGVEAPIEFISRLLSKAEVNYNATEREGLAVVFACQRFRHYLHGSKFEVRTDHKALEFIFRNPEPKGRLARWAVILSEFEFKVVHKAGCSNQVADALSRQRNAEQPNSGSDDAEMVVHADSARRDHCRAGDFVARDQRRYSEFVARRTAYFTHDVVERATSRRSVRIHVPVADAPASA